MNKLFGLFLLALACWAPGVAQAANRFLTCATTCTITAIDTSIWGTTTGGTGASVPGSSDAVILDGATCVGGTTCTATMGAGYAPTWQTFDMSACTASTSGCIFEANTNANTITLTGNFTNTGAGTRTLSGGTWVVSAANMVWNLVASATVTNAPSINFSAGSPVARQLVGGGKTYGTVTVSGGTGSVFIISGNNTIGTWTVSAPNRIQNSNGTVTTATTMTNVVATNTTPVLFGGSVGYTISSANNWSCTWCGFVGVTFSGGGTFSATNSLDFNGNTGISVTPPSGGGAGGGRIIGG